MAGLPVGTAAVLTTRSHRHLVWPRQLIAPPAALRSTQPLQQETAACKLQALVYDILPSNTALFSYAIGSIKLSANEQFFCWCSNSSMFVTDNSNKTRRAIYSRQQIKPQSFESRRNFLFFCFLPGVDAFHVYVRALALGCFYSHISTRTFRRAQ